MTQLNDIRDFFRGEFEAHGESAVGVGWNGTYAQEVRFEQLAKVIQPEKLFTVLDFGCGYGAMADWFRRNGYEFDHYYGVDIVPESLTAAKEIYQGDEKISFHADFHEIPQVDYIVASGVFNIKRDHDYEEWTDYILATLKDFNAKALRGFSSNFLTSYSDPERMAERPDLYYADPCRLFDYARRHFARNVSLLHDYKIWDFTIIVRKEND